MAKVTRLTLDQSGGLERRRLHLREISGDEDTPLETVGQDLRKARQRKGEDLATVSRALKIRKDHLEAIEESDFDALPGRAYAIGFIRTYSEYLGLDPAPCVERLKAEIAGRSEIKEETVPLSAPYDRKLPQGTMIFVVALLVALVWGGYQLAVSADRMLSQPVTPVPARLADQAGLTPAPQPAPVPESTVYGNAAQTPDAAAPDPQASAATPAPAESTGPRIPTAEEIAALPQGREYGATNPNARVILRMHKPARILVQGPDNTVFMNRAMRPGDLYQLPNTVGLTLSTPDSGAVEILLDGSSMGFVGRDGAIAEGVSLNPQAIVDRQGHPG